MNHFFKSLALGALSMACFACSTDEFTSETPGAFNGEQSKITLLISTPSAGDVVFKNAAKTITQEPEEWEIKTLNVYIFKKAPDGSYKFQSSTAFTGTDATNKLEQTTGTDAAYTCSLTIGSDLMEETVKILLLANDNGSVTLTQNSTTFEEFKQTLASATVATDSTATSDVLVGYVDASTSRGFAMSAQAKAKNASTSEYDTEEILLTAAGVDVQAILYRNVARVDIENATKNLTITGMGLHNTVNKSYLFSQGDNVYAFPSVPSSAISIFMNPMNNWKTQFDTMLAYNTMDTTQNVLKKVFYLYEQTAGTSEDDSPYVTISYRLTYTADDGSTSYSDHSVKVYFRTKADDGSFTYLPVKRNHLYKIKLGNYTEVDGKVELPGLTMEDWGETDIDRDGSNDNNLDFEF